MGRNWTEEEDNLLRQLIAKYGKQWSVLATHIPNRSATQIAARWEKCINPKLTKGPFSADEDELIREFVKTHGVHAWPKVTTVLPNRTAKQCRERWFNNLDPVVTKGPWTPEEDQMIFEAYLKFGPKWSTIARNIPGRTDNSIKNRWHASISKRMRVDEGGEQYLAPCKLRRHTKRARPPPIQTSIAPPPVMDPVVAEMSFVSTPGSCQFDLSGPFDMFPVDFAIPSQDMSLFSPISPTSFSSESSLNMY